MENNSNSICANREQSKWYIKLKETRMIEKILQKVKEKYIKMYTILGHIQQVRETDMK